VHKWNGGKLENKRIITSKSIIRGQHRRRTSKDGYSKFALIRNIIFTIRVHQILIFKWHKLTYPVDEGVKNSTNKYNILKENPL